MMVGELVGVFIEVSSMVPGCYEGKMAHSLVSAPNFLAFLAGLHLWKMVRRGIGEPSSTVADPHKHLFCTQKKLLWRLNA